MMRSAHSGTSTWVNVDFSSNGDLYLSGVWQNCKSSGCLEFLTPNGGSFNIIKSPGISDSCSSGSSNSMSYLYIAKLSTNGNWQWAKVAGGSTTGVTVYDIEAHNGSVYIAGDVEACMLGLNSGEKTSTANFGSYSLTLKAKCYQAGQGNACSGFTRDFVAKISSSGSWAGLINTSGDWTSQNTKPHPPTHLVLDVFANNLVLAGEFNQQSWGIKFGDFQLPTSGKSTFYVTLNPNNLSTLNSLIVGKTANQVICSSMYLVNGSYWVSGQFTSDFIIYNTTYVRTNAGEVFLAVIVSPDL